MSLWPDIKKEKLSFDRLCILSAGGVSVDKYLRGSLDDPLKKQGQNGVFLFNPSNRHAAL